MQTPTFTNTLSWHPFQRLTCARTSAQTVTPESRAIADHKWFLSERLGRDVGFTVAALDYRLNVQQQAAVAPSTPGPLEIWLLTALERLGEAHGAHAWASVSQSDQNRRSL